MPAVSYKVLETVALAVFKRSPVLVTELYSSAGEQPRRYDSAEALREHGRALQWVSGGMLLIGVQYADMGGAVRVRPPSIHPCSAIIPTPCRAGVRGAWSHR